MGLLSSWSARQIAQAFKAGSQGREGDSRADEPEPPDTGSARTASGQRLAWWEICRHEDYRGRWVALDDCRYDDAGNAAEGAVVDADEDLVELCSRLRASDRKNCAILHAVDDS